MYLVVIMILSFMVDNLTETFQMSIGEAMTSMFRMIANSNIKFWYPLINEAPQLFIIFVIMCVFWIFYIVNNVYFGIQFEIVRLLDATKEGKTLGFY
jgi:Na+/glutamate symporter